MSVLGVLDSEYEDDDEDEANKCWLTCIRPRPRAPRRPRYWSFSERY
jgi:hypothetical protein